MNGLDKGSLCVFFLLHYSVLLKASSLLYLNGVSPILDFLIITEQCLKKFDVMFLVCLIELDIYYNLSFYLDKCKLL